MLDRRAPHRSAYFFRDGNTSVAGIVYDSCTIGIFLSDGKAKGDEKHNRKRGFMTHSKEELMRAIEKARKALDESIDRKAQYEEICQESRKVDWLIEQYIAEGY